MICIEFDGSGIKRKVSSALREKGFKYCPKCKAIKSIKSFSQLKSGKIDKRCKNCRSTDANSWNKEHPEQYKKNLESFHNNNPGYKQSYGRWYSKTEAGRAASKKHRSTPEFKAKDAYKKHLLRELARRPVCKAFAKETEERFLRYKEYGYWVEKATGVPQDVDHIRSRNHKNYTGLHVYWNLTVEDYDYNRWVKSNNI